MTKQDISTVENASLIRLVSELRFIIAELNDNSDSRNLAEYSEKLVKEELQRGPKARRSYLQRIKKEALTVARERFPEEKWVRLKSVFPNPGIYGTEFLLAQVKQGEISTYAEYKKTLMELDIFIQQGAAEKNLQEIDLINRVNQLLSKAPAFDFS